ncbi:MAG: hypothetical protein RL026_792 [Pseudomonadota bacterium]|jgi:tryptophan-rich sensory protein
MSLGITIRTTPPRGQWGAAALSLLLVAGVAVVGALATLDAAAFYHALQKPSWAPPASVFGPVWTALYTLMAIAAWLVWRRAGDLRGAPLAFALYAVQLLLNALWSWLFFAWQLGLPALVDVSLLWLAVVLTTGQFWQIDRTAGLLMLPYLLWVGFATALNAACWQLNPFLLG